MRPERAGVSAAGHARIPRDPIERRQMSPPETPRLWQNRRYVAQGAEVHVVTCTLGKEGEVFGDRVTVRAVEAGDRSG